MRVHLCQAPLQATTPDSVQHTHHPASAGRPTWTLSWQYWEGKWWDLLLYILFLTHLVLSIVSVSPYYPRILSCSLWSGGLSYSHHSFHYFSHCQYSVQVYHKFAGNNNFVISNDRFRIIHHIIWGIQILFLTTQIRMWILWLQLKNMNMNILKYWFEKIPALIIGAMSTVYLPWPCSLIHPLSDPPPHHLLPCPALSPRHKTASFHSLKSVCHLLPCPSGSSFN